MTVAFTPPAADVALAQRCSVLLETLRQSRESWIYHWRDLGAVFSPRSPRFLIQDRNRGDKRHQAVVDAHPLLVARTLAAGMMGGMTNPARPWFNLKTDDADLNEQSEVKDWLDDARKRMSATYLASNLYSVLPSVYQDLGIFSVTAFVQLEDDETTIRFKHFPVGSFFLSCDDAGRPNTFGREFQQTCRQLVDRYGLAACPPRVRTAYEQRQFELPFDCAQLIMPNAESDGPDAEARRKPFVSVTWVKGSERDEPPLRVSGFDEFPAMCPRWVVYGEDFFGSDSPGMMALGDVQQLNLQQRKKLKAIGKMVDPPLAAPSEMATKRISLLEGDVTYLDRNQMQFGIKPLHEVNPRVAELFQDMAETRQRISKAFFEDLFLMLSNLETTQPLTAAEVAERKEEKLLLMGPVLQRFNDEVLDPMIRRTFGIMLRAGKFKPVPPQLRGRTLVVEYESTLAQAVKLSALTGIERLTQYVMSVMGADPSAADAFDFDAAVQAYADNIGVPPQLVRDAMELARVRAQKQQAAQQASLLEKAQAAATTAKTLSDAQTADPSALSALASAYGAPRA